MHPLLLKATVEYCRDRQNAGDCGGANVIPVERLEDAIVQLANQSADRDAERYRWLRNVMGTSDREAQDDAIEALGKVCREPTTPEQFDHAIDTVMASRAPISLAPTRAANTEE